MEKELKEVLNCEVENFLFVQAFAITLIMTNFALNYKITLIIFNMKKAFLSLALLLSALVANATIRLPKIFSDNMVIQRNAEIRIWGWADPKENVFIALNGKKVKTVASESGEWEISLPAMKAGGPYTLLVNDIKVNNILIGDVYLCSGQSNMELPMRRTADLYKKDMDSIVNTNVRYVKIPLTFNFREPQNDFKACDWKELNPKNAPEMSALCYYLGMNINISENVPVGIVNSSVGGSPIEAWMHYDALENYPAYRKEADKCYQNGYIEKTLKEEAEKMRTWNNILNETDHGLTEWTSLYFDDNKWEMVDMFSAWGAPDGKIVNGSHWLRQEIDVPEKCAGKEAVLRLGCIVDADSVYVNGVCIGSTGYQYPPRIYKVRPDLLRAGKNIIAVRVISYQGKPSFVREKPYKLTFNNGYEIALSQNWRHKIGSRMPARAGQTFFQYKPIGLYYGMIAPLNKFRFCGTVWFQGESNTSRANEYSDLLQKMVADWRKRQGYSNPFIIVQLANFMDTHDKPFDSEWAALRNAQREASTLIPDAALATALGLGEWNDIHPLKKRDVAERVFLQIERLVYKKDKMIAEGPVVKDVKVGKNGTVVLSFTREDVQKGSLRGFELAGESGFYYKADATSDGKTVTISCPDVKQPKSVRYAWDDNPILSLYNTNGMPAASFQFEVGYTAPKAKADKSAKPVKEKGAKMVENKAEKKEEKPKNIPEVAPQRKKEAKKQSAYKTKVAVIEERAKIEKEKMKDDSEQFKGEMYLKEKAIKDEFKANKEKREQEAKERKELEKLKKQQDKLDKQQKELDKKKQELNKK